jgi:hypothetical protein
MIFFTIQKKEQPELKYIVHVEAFSEKPNTGTIRYSNGYTDLTEAILDGRDIVLIAIGHFDLQDDDIHIYASGRNPEDGDDKIPARQIDSFVPTILSLFN